MAFRLGYQITCSYRTNTVFRKLSPNSSCRNKSLSPIPIKRELNVSHIYSNRESNLRTILSQERAVRPISQEFSSQKSQFIDSDSRNDSAPAAESTRNNWSYPREQALDKKQRPNKTKNALQPSRLTPIASSFIYNSDSYLPESCRPINIENLQRSANSQYAKAIASLQSQIEEETERYQLEAAKPRPDTNNSNSNLYQWYKKQYPTREDRLKAPKLQPRNIKPLGELNILERYGPSAKYQNQNLATQTSQIQKHQKTNRQTESNKPKLDENTTISPTLKRHYSTISESIPSTQLVSNLDRSNELFTANNQNSNYVEKQATVLQANNDKSNASTTDYEQTNNLPESKVAVQISNDFSNDATEESKIKKISELHFRNLMQLRTNSPEHSKPNITLYYEEKNGKKVLCSKVAKSGNHAIDVTSNMVDREDLLPVKARIGPKLMLQSMNDNEYRMEELVPAPNEKFTVPWLSWSDRVKLRKSIQTKTIGERIFSYTTDQNRSTVVFQRRCN